MAASLSVALLNIVASYCGLLCRYFSTSSDTIDNILCLRRPRKRCVCPLLPSDRAQSARGRDRG